MVEDSAVLGEGATAGADVFLCHALQTHFPPAPLLLSTTLHSAVYHLIQTYHLELYQVEFFLNNS